MSSEEAKKPELRLVKFGPTLEDQESIVESLERLLLEAKSGNIRGLFATTFNHPGGVTQVIQGRLSLNEIVYQAECLKLCVMLEKKV